MWKKPEPENPQPQPLASAPPAAPLRNTAAPAKERAVIGASIEIKGDLHGGEDLYIEGRVEGKVDLKRHNVSIGKNGRVLADLYGRVITVEGEVQGNLYGEEQIVLRQSSTVRGNLTAPRVSLEDGANFKGSIDMSPKESPAASPKTGPATAAGPPGSAAPRP